MTFVLKYFGYDNELKEMHYQTQLDSINECINAFKKLFKERNIEFPKYYEIYKLIHVQDNLE